MVSWWNICEEVRKERIKKDSSAFCVECDCYMDLAQILTVYLIADPDYRLHFQGTIAGSNDAPQDQI